MTTVETKSFNFLSATPGDRILFRDDTDSSGFSWDTVKHAMWQRSAKGGKVWSYEVISGKIVPYYLITEIKKQEHPMKESPPVNPRSDFGDDAEDFMKSLSNHLNNSSFQPPLDIEEKTQNHQDFLTIDMRDLHFLLATAIRCVSASREEKSSFRELKYLRTASKLLELRIKELNDKAPIRSY